jgi:DNA-binding transcriptional LysR family regulator
MAGSTAVDGCGEGGYHRLVERDRATTDRVDLNQVDLNLLVAFDALLAERSVTRAAARLSVGQSAMSATLARLRRLLDDPVLVREGRELVATPFAEALVKPVREVLDDITAVLRRRDRFDPATAERAFAVQASDYVSTVFLARALRGLTTDAPGVRLDVTPPGDDLAVRLRSGATDLAIVPREAFPEHDDFPHAELFTDRFVCVVDASNADVGDSITVEQFSSMPYVATSCGHQVSPAESQLDRLGIRRNTELTTAFHLAPLLVAGTPMIALVHERLATDVAGRSSLRIIDPPVPMAPIHELLLWPALADADPAHQWLRGRLLAAAEALDPIEALQGRS